MKRSLVLIFLTGVLAGCVSFAVNTNEGIGEGYQGPIRVKVRFSAGSILDIEILDHNDDELVGGAAMRELLEAALESNTTDLDAISGATESSIGFLTAVDEAMKSSYKSLR